MKQQCSYNAIPVSDDQPVHITLDRVTMAYPMAPLQRRSIKSDVMSLLRPHAEREQAPQFVTALDDVSLVISQGERLGIVGHNGAGKSSLLRLIAGVYLPQRGAVTVAGRVQSLFDIAIGFESHATGRDNITYRGLVMGLAPEAIHTRVDEIIRFADIGDFIDLPVRTYSTGMAVRLAFAISTCLEGDILLIDEIFGAGDLSFASKAKARMKELIGQARIVCFASHDLATIRDICTRAIWVHGGKIRADGDVDSVTRAYESMATGVAGARSGIEQTAQLKTQQVAPPIETTEPRSEGKVASDASEAGAKNAEFMLAQQQARAATAAAEPERLNNLLVEVKQRKMAVHEELDKADTTASKDLLDTALQSSQTAWAEAKRINDLLFESRVEVERLKSEIAHLTRISGSIVTKAESGTMMLGAWSDEHGFDTLLAERDRYLAETSNAMWGIDGAVLLMIPGWDEEMRGNRWHVTNFLTQRMPVLIVQPCLLPSEHGPRIRRDKRFRGAWVLETLYHVGPIEDNNNEQLRHVRDIEWAMRRLGVGRPLYWLFSPYFGRVFAQMVGYRLVHATEDWLRFPALPAWAREGYVEALAVADSIIAVSSGVAASLRELSPPATIDVVVNGCQYAQYAASGPPHTLVSAARKSAEQLAVFAGNIDGRLDYELLNRIVKEIDDVRICMVGPVAGLSELDAAEWSAFVNHERVTWLGRLEPDELPAVYRAADAGIVPYKHEVYLVESNFSLKILEMAAAGLPVVVSLMKPVAGVASAIEVSGDSASFVENLRRRLRTGMTEAEAKELEVVAKRGDYGAKFADILMDVMQRFRSGAHSG